MKVKKNTLVAFATLGAAVLAISTADAQAMRSQSAGSGSTTVSGFWAKAPTFEELVDKLADLRNRKRYDKAHGNKYQQYLAAEIAKVKAALRNHHRQRGWTAAKNDPIDK
jgi:hypothetical protein